MTRLTAAGLNHRRTMEQLRTEYEAGDKAALAMAILGCGICHRPLPSWVVDAWWSGFNDVSMRVADWNDVLGDVQVKTPKQIERERRKIEQLGKLVQLLPTARAPIGRDSDGAFRELAKGMGIKPRAVRELYYMTTKYDGKKIRVLSSLVLRRRASPKKK